MPRVFISRDDVMSYYPVYEDEDGYFGSYYEVTDEELALIRKGQEQQQAYQNMLFLISNREMKEEL